MFYVQKFLNGRKQAKCKRTLSLQLVVLVTTSCRTSQFVVALALVGEGCNCGFFQVPLSTVSPGR
ncbi:hypothetical protein BDD14_2801 [Edaphobacter modestus]|uniref:Uncharacterized protein n=1 Tax=Edaphobacter modestus TaxID=388466 RepID=A0A4Q7YUJ7_9BACT|nr:hypothetical protein BDD14_2801 [Edaphobacter modestus]